MGRGREQYEVSSWGGREVFEEGVALLLIRVCPGGGSSAVRLVHDDKTRAVLEEVIALPVAFHKINADNLDRVMAVNAAAAMRYSPFKLVHRAGADYRRIEAELLTEFFLPLLAQVRRADHA